MERIALQSYAGHEIELVVEHKAGEGPRTWFEVRDPATGVLRGRFRTRREAERHLSAVFPGVPAELGRIPAVPRRQR
ncbi:MAG: hypothetical protein KatS3mg125_0126 [Lysobacterales bacterium]|jgi:hypothetical protein|nr:MAG: hypothetical protein KatS3mg125_0126 [Xanthomonadales bacterium]